MGFRIEVFEGDTVSREIALTDEAGAAYDLTGKVVTLDIGLSLGASSPVLSKSTATPEQMQHDGAGGVVTVHFLAADWDVLKARGYAATLRIDGDTVDNGIVFVTPTVPAP